MKCCRLCTRRSGGRRQIDDKCKQFQLEKKQQTLVGASFPLLLPSVFSLHSRGISGTPAGILMKSPHRECTRREYSKSVSRVSFCPLFSLFLFLLFFSKQKMGVNREAIENE